jgi:predicted O-methyltransferase YrrM
MTQEQWSAVDRYLTDLLMPDDAVLAAVLQHSAESGLPAIQVAPNQGKLLMLLAKAMNARNILEIGTLGAYSTIWLARALPPDGHLITLELEPKHAEVARANLERAGFSNLVEVRLGRALQGLARIAEEVASGTQAPFDLVFIDADKPSYPDYFDWALSVSHVGTLIIGDNVVRDGAIIDKDNKDPRVQGMRLFHEHVAREPRVSATAIQTVGSKGYDGLSLALVVSAEQ